MPITCLRACSSFLNGKEPGWEKACTPCPPTLPCPFKVRESLGGWGSAYPSPAQRPQKTTSLYVVVKLPCTFKARESLGGRGSAYAPEALLDPLPAWSCLAGSVTTEHLLPLCCGASPAELRRPRGCPLLCPIFSLRKTSCGDALSAESRHPRGCPLLGPIPWVLQARPLTGEVCERTGLLPVCSYVGLLPGELVRRRGPAGVQLGRRRAACLEPPGCRKTAVGPRGAFLRLHRREVRRAAGGGALGGLVGPRPPGKM
ncbi:hypothetical protein NDU88_001823 [Pleurodeles waltl]|uniref:Uncharacterized protein n=1 Tax=Pleurodeles waltl TaxID=8319 RepID=A0AAV7UBI0_PLEWA|nr:hypothetical protein NDU88_001823 [Pleurodeles waltl]